MFHCSSILSVFAIFLKLDLNEDLLNQTKKKKTKQKQLYLWIWKQVSSVEVHIKN